MKHSNRLAILPLFLIIAVFNVLAAFPREAFAGGSLTSSEIGVLGLVNGTEAYSFDLQLENIALSHFSFRSAGSAGANEAADWIASQFESFGLEVKKEEFQFTSWELVNKPTLVIDDDGNFETTGDQETLESFQSTHYSWPGELLADLVVLPLPPAANRGEIGVYAIDTAAWQAVDTTGKVLLIGREVRLDHAWQETYTNKLRTQTPLAVIYTWWYDWMAFVPDFFSSAGGRPASPFGSYYWDLSIPVGFVDYDDGLLIRNREISLDVSAEFVIDSVVEVGPHYNVVGKLTGFEEPDKFVIVAGHYDTVMCAGFCDNGAGTSGVIELARIFTEAAKRGLYYPKFTILFVAFAAEEIGLVGSINYVAQHKVEMENIVGVINLDCIGSDNLEITETDPDHGLDLDQIAFDASGDLGVSARLVGAGGSDEIPFLYPPDGDGILMWFWETSLDISDAHPVRSSCTFGSSPTTYRDEWNIGMPGWIHTSYDNSTSTETQNWVEVQDLEDHVGVAALTIMRVSPRVLIGDINNDRTVDIFDAVLLARSFGSSHGDPNWSQAADLNDDDIIDIFDAVLFAKNFGNTV